MKKGLLVLVLLAVIVFGVMSNREMRTQIRSEYNRIVVGDQQVTLAECNQVMVGMDRDQVVGILNEGRLAGKGVEISSSTTQGLDLSSILPGMQFPGFEMTSVKWVNDDGSYFGVVLTNGVVTGKTQGGLK